MKKLSLITYFIWVILFFCSCKKSDNEIKIGVITHLTGNAQTYGMSMKNGIDIAISEINADGGVKGKILKAIYEDDQLKPLTALNAFRKLTDIDQVSAIIGSGASSITLKLAPKAQEKKIVLISSISTADSLKNAGEYFFRVVPSNSVQGITAANFVVDDLERETAVILYANDDYGLSLANSFENEFKRRGKMILSKESFYSGVKDFKSQLIKIKNLNPQIVFAPCVMPEAGLIIKQFKELRMNSILILGDGAYSIDNMIRIAGDAANGTYYTVMSLPQDTSLQFTKFKVEFVRRNSIQPDIWAVLAYDATYALYYALLKCDEINGTEIMNNLHNNLIFNGLSGQIKFDANGEVQKSYSIYLYDNGQYNLYKY